MSCWIIWKMQFTNGEISTTEEVAAIIAKYKTD